LIPTAGARKTRAAHSLVLPAACAFAHRALTNRDSRLRAAALIFRRGLAELWPAVFPCTFAHRALCAAAILALADALMVRFFGAAPNTEASSCSRVSIRSLTAIARSSCAMVRLVSELVMRPV
jgi:glutathionyl-hydroquinone reductase